MFHVIEEAVVVVVGGPLAERDPSNGAGQHPLVEAFAQRVRGIFDDPQRE
jgi:hypothetical protein